MARKKKKKAKRRGAAAVPAELPNDALEAEIAQSEADEDFKAMLAAAKVLHKRRSDADSSRRVADAYAGRIRQLAAKGLFQEAAALLPLRDRHLDQGLSAEERSVSLHVLIRAGQWQEAAKAIRSWNDPAAQPFAAELVLLYPESAGSVDPAGRLTADRNAVQEALAAYDQGADEAALEALRPLGLKSPFRYWKLFIRGLVAFYGGDEETATKSFARIPATLPVADLATDFLAILSPEAKAPSGRPLGQESGNAPSLTEYAAELQRAVDWGDTNKGLKKLSALLGAFPDEPRVHRIAATFCWHGLSLSQRSAEPRIWAILKGALGRFIFDDPEFARTLALSFERNGDWHSSVTAWTKFANSLGAGRAPAPGGFPENRARAEICVRVARNSSKDLLGASRNPFSFGRLPTAEALGSIDYFLELALAQDPASVEPYLAGMRIARDDWEDVDHAFRRAERLVKAFPNHLQGLLSAADLGLKRGVYRKALGFVKKAEALEPLHLEVHEKRSQCLLLSARKRASELKRELARKDYLEALSSVTGERAAKVKIELGCLEAAVDNVQAGRDWIDQGVQALGDGVGTLFRVVVEAGAKMSDRSIREPYLADIKKRLSKSESKQAVELAGVFREYQHVSYPGQDRDRDLVVAHVKRCAKKGYSREDAFTLCRFLADEMEYKILATLAGRSAKAHPDDFHFPVFQTLAKAKTRPRQLEWKDEERLEACRRKASEAGEARFARFVDEVLEAVDPWVWEEDEEDEWDELPTPFDAPADLLDAINEIFGGRSKASGRKAKKSAQGEGAAPPAEGQRPAATQLNLFGDDE